jgi:hypothetical protein
MRFEFTPPDRLTGFTATNLHDMLARCRAPKIGVKSHDPIDLRPAQIQPRRDDANGFVRDVAQLVLDVVQNRQRRSRPVGMPLDDCLNPSQIHDCLSLFVPTVYSASVYSPLQRQ